MTIPSIDLNLFVHNAPDVHEQPRMVLTQWQVFDDGQACYLAGLLPNGQTMRVTTAIKSVRAPSRTWVTSSGRVYETPGMPATDAAVKSMLEKVAMVITRAALAECSDQFLASFAAHVKSAAGQPSTATD